MARTAEWRGQPNGADSRMARTAEGAKRLAASMSGAARAVIPPRDGDSRLGKPRPLQTNEHLVDRHEAISQGKERRRRDSIG